MDLVYVHGHQHARAGVYETVNTMYGAGRWRSTHLTYVPFVDAVMIALTLPQRHIQHVQDRGVVLMVARVCSSGTHYAC